MKLSGNPLTEPSALAEWWTEVYKPEGGKVSYNKYRAMSSACWDLFKYVSQAGGYDARSNQQWIHVKLSKDADIAAALTELNLFLPRIRETDGYKHFGVFEHTLSEDGMYELRQYAASDIRLIITRYQREHEVERFDNWTAALEYIKANHWYGAD